MAQQYSPTTFVTIPLNADGNGAGGEKERIQKLFPQKMMKNISIAQLVFGGIAAVTQVLNHMKKLKQHSKEFFVIFSSGVTSCVGRGVLLLRWNDLHWNRDLDRSVFCHFRRNRPSGFSKTFLLHGDSLHGHEHHLCPFCHSLDRLCWHWYR